VLSREVLGWPTTCVRTAGRRHRSRQGGRDRGEGRRGSWQGGQFWSYIGALTVDPQAPDRLYFGLHGSKQQIRASDDAGAFWSDLPPPADLPSVTAEALGADRLNLDVATSWHRSGPAGAGS